MRLPNAIASCPFSPRGLTVLISPSYSPVRNTRMMGTLCMRHCRLLFIKHVLPRFTRPTRPGRPPSRCTGKRRDNSNTESSRYSRQQHSLQTAATAGDTSLPKPEGGVQNTSLAAFSRSPLLAVMHPRQPSADAAAAAVIIVQLKLSCDTAAAASPKANTSQQRA